MVRIPAAGGRDRGSGNALPPVCYSLMVANGGIGPQSGFRAVASSPGRKSTPGPRRCARRIDRVSRSAPTNTT
jgi:hypothetical protein